MRSLALWDWFEVGGCQWQVVAVDPGDAQALRIRCSADGIVRKVSAGDLLHDESFLNQSQPAEPTLSGLAILETLPVLERKRVETLAELLRASGVLDPGPLSRDRLKAAADELSRGGIKVGERQIWRYRRAHRDHGVAGLVDQRRAPPLTPRRVDPRVVEAAEALISGEKDESTGTRSRMIQRLRWSLSGTDVQIPSDRTLYRLLSELDRGRSTFSDATTRRSKAARPDRTYGGVRPTRPGELVEIDSTPLDVEVMLPDGTRGRPELTYAIDVATGTIGATMLRAGAAKSVDVGALLLARMLTPLPHQPGWKESIALARAILPHDVLPDDSAWHRLAMQRPVIMPETVTLDRGRVFTGAVFAAACERLQVSQVFANPRQATDKPHVESGFKRIRERFVQYLAGYTGGSVARRGLRGALDSLWSFNELQVLLDLWVLSDWQTTPQSGLRIPGMPKRTLSPNQMYSALASAAPAAVFSLQREDYIALMPVVYRAVQVYGINLHGLVYDCPDLHPLRNRKPSYQGRSRGLWEVRFDPYNLSVIWVRAGDETWIEAEWSLARHAVRPFSLEVLKAAIKAVNSTSSPSTSINVLEQINRIQTGRAQSLRERRSARSSSTVKGLVPPPTGESPAAAPADPVREPDSLPTRRLRRLD